MNISKITLLNPANLICAKNTQYNNTIPAGSGYGLKMAKPLQRDTVSFKAGVQTNKQLGELADLITHGLSKRIREEYTPIHEKMVKLVRKRFGKLIESNLVSFGARLKEGFSLREKTTTIDASTHVTIMREMKDISGGCFILNDKKAFGEMVDIIIKMIKNKEIDVIEAEHYTTYAGENKNSLTALDISAYKKLASVVENANKDSSKKVTRMDDSKAGYSGLHLLLRWKGKNGELPKYTEWQIMTRAMHEFKDGAENFYYKKKFGKRIADKYRPIIDPILEPLAPINEKYATKKEIKEYNKLRTDIDEYTLDSYRERNNNPFESRPVFLHPTKPSLERFDFNTIYYLKDGIDKGKIGQY